MKIDQAIVLTLLMRHTQSGCEICSRYNRAGATELSLALESCAGHIERELCDMKPAQFAAITRLAESQIDELSALFD